MKTTTRGDLCYDTHITDDVIGYLSEDEAEKILNDIAALPRKRKCKYEIV